MIETEHHGGWIYGSRFDTLRELRLLGAGDVLVRSGTSWSQQAHLKASNTDASGAPEYYAL